MSARAPGQIPATRSAESSVQVKFAWTDVPCQFTEIRCSQAYPSPFLSSRPQMSSSPGASFGLRLHEHQRYLAGIAETVGFADGNAGGVGGERGPGTAHHPLAVPLTTIQRPARRSWRSGKSAPPGLTVMPDMEALVSGERLEAAPGPAGHGMVPVPGASRLIQAVHQAPHLLMGRTRRHQDGVAGLGDVELADARGGHQGAR